MELSTAPYDALMYTCRSSETESAAKYAGASCSVSSDIERASSDVMMANRTGSDAAAH